jgi:Peptidase family M1 domain
MATYVSYTAMQDAGLADPWTAFCYREKARAYQADALPGRQPVSSPVATAADAMLRLPALTYSKGAAVVRQLAALIGDDALRAGLADFMRRFGGGTAGLDELVACWSRSSGRDLGGWAQEWLRGEGASTLRASVVAGPDGSLASLAVEQDQPRTHRLGLGFYERSDGVLRRRRVIRAEISGARCEVAVPAGEPVPDALVLNDGDLTYAQVAFDPATLDALAGAAMVVGDPLTEAMCWNETWRMVTTGSLAGADFAGLVIRRLAGSPVPPEVGVEMALDGGRDWRVALASARGIWVPGQEAVLDEYRERYFTEALPALDGRGIHVMRNLARALYPATLVEDATLTATAAALEHGALSQALRLVVKEQEAILRSVLAGRSVVPRYSCYSSLLVEGGGVGGNVDGIGLEDLKRDDLERTLVG